MNDLNMPLSTSYFETSGVLAEMSEMPCVVPGGQCVLEERPALDARMTAICDAVGLVDETEGHATWVYTLDLPDGMSLHVQRYDRQATIQAGLRMCALLLAGPLPCTGTIKTICEADEDIPAILCVYTTAPEVGDLQLWAAAETMEATAALITRWAPHVR